MEYHADCQERERGSQAVADLQGLGVDHALESYGESIDSVVKEESQGRGGPNVPGMLAIDFIQYTIEQVAERLAKEVRSRNGVLVVVTDRGPAHTEKDDPWREGEYPSGQRNLHAKKVIHTSAKII